MYDHIRTWLTEITSNFCSDVGVPEVREREDRPLRCINPHVGFYFRSN